MTRTTSVTLEARAYPMLNLLMLHAGISPLQYLAVGGTDDDLRDCWVRVSATPDVVEPRSISIAKRSPEGILDPPTLVPRLERFLAFEDEGIPGKLEVAILSEHDNGRIPILRQVKPVTIQAANEWVASGPGRATLAGLITPNSSAVSEVLRRTKGNLEAYQTEGPREMLAEVRAVYEAVRGLELAYVGEPPSYERTGQKVLFPDRLLDVRRGCCLDLTVLTAAVLERAGYRPVVVAVEGHAFNGVWLDPEGTFGGPVLDTNASREVRRAVAARRLLVWNSTTICDPRTDHSFPTAMRDGKRRLGEVRWALDIAACRAQGIRPLSRAARTQGLGPAIAGPTTAKTTKPEAWDGSACRSLTISAPRVAQTDRDGTLPLSVRIENRVSQRWRVTCRLAAAASDGDRCPATSFEARVAALHLPADAESLVTGFIDIDDVEEGEHYTATFDLDLGPSRANPGPRSLALVGAAEVPVTRIPRFRSCSGFTWFVVARTEPVSKADLLRQRLEV